MKNDFQQSLKHITSDAPVNYGLLHGLSMLNKTNLARFEAAWPAIASARRLAIMQALVTISEQNFEVSFDPVFILGMNDPDAEVQTAAIKGLWENESPALIPPLIHLLKKGQSSGVRAASATALGQFIYLGEIEEIDSAAFMLAEQALLETVRRPGEEIEVVRRAVEAISFSSQEGIEQIIENAYYHEDELMRISAIFAMGRNYNSKWGKIAIAELDNRNPAVRFEAARTCGELALKESVDRLIRLINEETDSEVQQNAIWSLGQIGGPAAQEVLETLTDSPDEIISSVAEEALDELLLLGGELSDIFAYNLGSDFDDDDDFDDTDDFDDDDDYKTYNLN